MRRSYAVALALGCSALAWPAAAQAPDPGRIAAQKEAMAPLAFMDGVWRQPSPDALNELLTPVRR